MAAETGFMIDGTIYEVPDMTTFTMGERRLMFELTGMVQEDFVQDDDESDEDHDARVTKMTRHPGFMETMMLVAYQRANPGVKRDKVKLVIDKTTFIDAVQGLAGDEQEEADALPPALKPKPEDRSSLETSSPSTHSGNGSSTSSEAPVVQLAPTTTSESDTSSTSDRTASTA